MNTLRKSPIRLLLDLAFPYILLTFYFSVPLSGEFPFGFCLNPFGEFIKAQTQWTSSQATITLQQPIQTKPPKAILFFSQKNQNGSYLKETNPESYAHITITKRQPIPNIQGLELNKIQL